MLTPQTTIICPPAHNWSLTSLQLHRAPGSSPAASRWREPFVSVQYPLIWGVPGQADLLLRQQQLCTSAAGRRSGTPAILFTELATFLIVNANEALSPEGGCSYLRRGGVSAEVRCFRMLLKPGGEVGLAQRLFVVAVGHLSQNVILKIKHFPFACAILHLI